MADADEEENGLRVILQSEVNRILAAFRNACLFISEIDGYKLLRVILFKFGLIPRTVNCLTVFSDVAWRRRMLEIERSHKEDILQQIGC